MKTFCTSGTGSQQTLSEIETDKVPVYNSRADVTADLANLAVGQIVATKDTGTELSQPVDAVQSGNMHAVTSNAVARECLTVETLDGNTADGGGHFTIKKCGKVVTIDVWGMVAIANIGTQVVTSLQEGYRPSRTIVVAGFSGSGRIDPSNMLGFAISTQGDITVYPYVALTDSYPQQLHASWIVD